MDYFQKIFDFLKALHASGILLEVCPLWSNDESFPSICQHE
jgi:hypothetical protein